MPKDRSSSKDAKKAKRSTPYQRILMDFSEQDRLYELIKSDATWVEVEHRIEIYRCTYIDDPITKKTRSGWPGSMWHFVARRLGIYKGRQSEITIDKAKTCIKSFREQYKRSNRWPQMAKISSDDYGKMNKVLAERGLPTMASLPNSNSASASSMATFFASTKKVELPLTGPSDKVVPKKEWSTNATLGDESSTGSLENATNKSSAGVDNMDIGSVPIDEAMRSLEAEGPEEVEWLLHLNLRNPLKTNLEGDHELLQETVKTVLQRLQSMSIDIDDHSVIEVTSRFIRRLIKGSLYVSIDGIVKNLMLLPLQDASALNKILDIEKIIIKTDPYHVSKVLADILDPDRHLTADTPSAYAFHNFLKKGLETRFTEGIKQRKPANPCTPAVEKQMKKSAASGYTYLGDYYGVTTVGTKTRVQRYLNKSREAYNTFHYAVPGALGPFKPEDRTKSDYDIDKSPGIIIEALSQDKSSVEMVMVHTPLFPLAKDSYDRKFSPCQSATEALASTILKGDHNISEPGDPIYFRVDPLIRQICLSAKLNAKVIPEIGHIFGSKPLSESSLRDSRQGSLLIHTYQSMFSSSVFPENQPEDLDIDHFDISMTTGSNQHHKNSSRWTKKELDATYKHLASNNFTVIILFGKEAFMALDNYKDHNIRYLDRQNTLQVLPFAGKMNKITRLFVAVPEPASEKYSSTVDKTWMIQYGLAVASLISRLDPWKSPEDRITLFNQQYPELIDKIKQVTNAIVHARFLTSKEYIRSHKIYSSFPIIVDISTGPAFFKILRKDGKIQSCELKMPVIKGKGKYGLLFNGQVRLRFELDEEARVIYAIVVDKSMATPKVGYQKYFDDLVVDKPLLSIEGRRQIWGLNYKTSPNFDATD
ncbi:hypothetical protein V865_005623 [Kwoniella europaea PYCC6329]|uniref:Uncharacterized protein n=1 Tax=Kwoniella europaea PYCC6329 TaxID=1423913 RepID=A0AAX4KNY8_9TREE